MFQRRTTGSVVCPSCGSLVGVRDDKCYTCGRSNPGLWGFGPALREEMREYEKVASVMKRQKELEEDLILNELQYIRGRISASSAILTDRRKTEEELRRYAAELRGQYLLQYYGNSNAPSGQFRRIQVAVPARNDVRVRARQGYYPKKSD